MIGEVTVEVTNSSRYFSWDSYGLNLSVPEGSLPAGVEKCVLIIRALLAPPFKPPKGHDLVSAVYDIKCEPEIEFIKELILEIEHCEDSDTSINLQFVRGSSTRDDFSLETASFPDEERYGYLQVQRFAGFFAVFNNKQPLLETQAVGSAGGPTYPGCIVTQTESSPPPEMTEASPAPPAQRRYCVMLFYKVHSTRKINIEVAICHDLQTHVKALKTHYIDDNGYLPGPRMSIKFENEIELEIQDVSATHPEAKKYWTFTSLSPPVFEKETIDNWSNEYQSCGVIPSIQLTATIDQSDDRAYDLSQKFTLNGAHGAYNWFRLAINKEDFQARTSSSTNIANVDSRERVFFSSVYWKLDGRAKQLSAKGVLVAVLDSGVNSSHLALENSYSCKRIKFGRNFIENESPDTFNDTDPLCHGTGVASVIAGKHLNAKLKGLSNVNSSFTGFANKIPLGVAPEASLVICRVSTSHPYPEAVVKALKWIYTHNSLVMGSGELDSESVESHKSACTLDHSTDIKNKICIVNMSIRLGLDPNIAQDKIVIDRLKEVTGKLRQQKVVCIAGAGNDGNNYDPGYPALLGDVISVGAVDSFGVVANFSTRDAKIVDMYALGKDILVAKNNATTESEDATDGISTNLAISPHQPPAPPMAPRSSKTVIDKGSFHRVSGTSFATPAVSGLLAILVQCARDQGGEGLVNRLTDFDTLMMFLKKHLLYKINEHDNVWLLRPQLVEKFFKEEVKDINFVLDHLNN